MSPDKRPSKKRVARAPARKAAAPRSARDPGPPYVVRWHPEALAERDASWPPRERAAIVHAAQKLEAEGGRLSHPHSSAVQGEAGKGLRELRPRGGRSRWRPIYRQVAPDTFLILAVAPEAAIDRAGFDTAVARASKRLSEVDTD